MPKTAVHPVGNEPVVTGYEAPRVFFALGLFSFVCAGVSWRYLPRSM